MRNVVGLRRIFREWDIDAVYTHFSMLRYHVEIAAKVAGLTVIRGEHNFTFDSARRFRFAKRLFWNLTTDFYIPVSNAVAEHLIEHVTPEGNVMVVPNGFDFSTHKRSGRGLTREDVAADLELPSDAVFLLCAARLHPSKGQDRLVEALRHIRHRNTVLLLAGSGEHHEYVNHIKALVQRFGLQNRVRLLGYRSDVGSLMSVSVVTLLASKFEGSPNVVGESMSLGTPVIASDIPPTREIVSDGIDGYLVKGGDPNCIAAKVEKMIENPALRDEMGRNAQQSVKARFSKERFLEETDHALEKALGFGEQRKEMVWISDPQNSRRGADKL